MRQDDEASRTLEQKKFSLKQLYFHRYLAIRYLTALYFFTNLNWFILLAHTRNLGAGIPLLLLLFSFPAVAEQVRLYRDPQIATPFTKRYFKLQTVCNLILLIITVSTGFHFFFPFMNVDIQGRGLTAGLLMAGGLLGMFGIRRLQQINHNRDRRYIQIKEYEDSFHAGEESY